MVAASPMTGVLIRSRKFGHTHTHQAGAGGLAQHVGGTKGHQSPRRWKRPEGPSTEPLEGAWPWDTCPDLGLDRFLSLEPLGAVLGQAAGKEH